MSVGGPRPIERTIFFTDAVMAIAMTLLILPLLEAVSEAAREGLDAAGFLREHQGQLGAFALTLALLVPGVDYWSLLVLLLSFPLELLIQRLLG